MVDESPAWIIAIRFYENLFWNTWMIVLSYEFSAKLVFKMQHGERKLCEIKFYINQFDKSSTRKNALILPSTLTGISVCHLSADFLAPSAPPPKNSLYSI